MEILFTAAAHTNHLPNCNWKEKARKDNEDAHQMHLKTCTCSYKESHIHNIRCTWAKNFIKIFKLPVPDDIDNLIKVCCCFPQIAHDESNKFIIKIDPSYKNKPLFGNLQAGALEIKNKNCCLNLNFAVDVKINLTGRNIELYNTFTYLCNEGQKNRVVTIYGEKGLGKNSLAKLTGRYMYERNIFPDGVVYINTQAQVVNDMWFVRKIMTSLELDNESSSFDDIGQFCNLIGNFKILIIVKFTQSQEEAVQDFKRILKYIIDNTISIKFLIAMTKPFSSYGVGIELQETKIQLQPLDSNNSAKLINNLAGAYLPDNLKNNISALRENEIVTISKGIPSILHKIIGLLQEHKKYEVVIERIRKENMKMENLSDELIQILLSNINSHVGSNDLQNENSEIIYELLYLLSILPNGILENQILAIFAKSKNEVYSILEHMITSSSMIVSKIYNKDLKSNVYTLSVDLISSIEMINIKEEIKTRIYREIVIYYSKICRHIVHNISSNFENAREFSAAQNNGLWLSLNLNNPDNIYNKYKEEIIYEPIKQFNFDETNILNLLKIENKILKILIANKDQDFIEGVEQLSICIPSILGMSKKMADCLSCYDHCIKLCGTYNLVLAHARLLLFTAGAFINIKFKSRYNSGSNGNGSNISDNWSKIIVNISQAEELFKANNFEEGIAESHFIKGVLRADYELDKSSKSEKNLNNYNNLAEKFENEIRKELSIAMEIYKNIKKDISLARVLYTMGDYYLKFNCGSEINFNSDNNLNSSTNSNNSLKPQNSITFSHVAPVCYFKEAIDIFTKNNKHVLKIKSLLGISKYYLESKVFNLSISYAEQARVIAEQLAKSNKKLMLHEIKKDITEIIDKSKEGSSNVCVFLSANQLVKKSCDLLFGRSQSIEISMYANKHDLTNYDQINYVSKLSNKLTEKLSLLNKEIILKFDFLTEANFKDYLSKIGRVLCISSLDYDDKNGSLIIENLEGEGIELPAKGVETIIKQIAQVNYDIVIIAIPQSEQLAKLFIENNFKHCICFNFNQEFLHSAKLLPMKSYLSAIDDFVATFIEKSLTLSIREAFVQSRNEFNNSLIKIDRYISEFFLRNYSQIDTLKDPAELGEVHLFPLSNDIIKDPHDIKLYEICTDISEGEACEINNQSQTMSLLKEGKVLNLSKKKGIINIKNKNRKKNNPLIGRKKELFEGFKSILDVKFLNIYGETGMGKTVLSEEICSYLHQRSYFSSGIFYIDLNNIKSIEKIKEILQEEEFYAALEASNKLRKAESSIDYRILLVLDNVDQIIEYADNNLFLLLSALSAESNTIHFVLISSIKVNNKNNEQFEYLQLSNLEIYESAYFFLSYCRRPISNKEIDFDKSDNDNSYSISECKNLVELISLSSRLKMCRGIPKYIRLLSEKAFIQTLKSIDYIDFLPKHLIIQTKRKFSLLGINGTPNISNTNNIQETIEQTRSFLRNNLNHKNLNISNTAVSENIDKKMFKNMLGNFGNDKPTSDNSTVQVGGGSGNRKILKMTGPTLLRQQDNSLNNSHNNVNSYNSLNSSVKNTSLNSSTMSSNNKQFDKLVNDHLKQLKNNNYVKNSSKNNYGTIEEEQTSNYVIPNNFEKITQFNFKLDKMIDRNLINSIQNIKQLNTIVKLPSFKFDQTTKKWILNHSYGCKSDDFILQSDFALITQYMSNNNNTISLENSIVLYSPDVFVLQNLTVNIIEQLANLKYIQDNYKISCNLTQDRFPCIFSKHNLSCYTFSNKSSKESFIFTLFDIVQIKGEGVKNILLVNGAFNSSFLQNNLNSFLGLTEDQKIKIVTGYFSEEMFIKKCLNKYEDSWITFKSNNFLDEVDGITDFKNNTRPDRIYTNCREFKGSITLEFFDIIDKDNKISVERAGIYGKYSFK